MEQAFNSQIGPEFNIDEIDNVDTVHQDKRLEAA